MTKTFLEKKYDKEVIRYICSQEIHEDEREALIFDFHINSEDYYDNLCDALYAISTGQNMNPIWITPSGNCYLSLQSQGTRDRILIYADQVPPFHLDLIDQLEVTIPKI